MTTTIKLRKPRRTPPTPTTPPTATTLPDESLDPSPGHIFAPAQAGGGLNLDCAVGRQEEGSCASDEADADAEAEGGGLIPRTTIATWRTKNESEFPPHWRESRARLVELHPAAQVLMWRGTLVEK